MSREVATVFIVIFNLDLTIENAVITRARKRFHRDVTSSRPVMETIFQAPCYPYELHNQSYSYMGTVNVSMENIPCWTKSSAAASVRCLTFQNKIGVGCRVGEGKNYYRYCDVCKDKWRGYNACKLPNAGTSYQGRKGKTITGRACMSWDKAIVMSKKFPAQYESIQASSFPDKKIIGLTKCRNPTPYSRDGVWCYVAEKLSGDVYNWEYCDPCGTDPGLKIYKGIKTSVKPSLPISMPNLHSCMTFCALHVECRLASFVERKCFIYGQGIKYLFNPIISFGYENKIDYHLQAPGPLKVTSQYTLGDVWQPKTFGLMRNYSAWSSYLLPTGGITYSGSQNVTIDGTACLPWVLFMTRERYSGNHFPEQSVFDAGNYCRQTGKYIGRPYCHVNLNDPKKIKACDVISTNPRVYKSCVLPSNGYLYRGSKSVTITGRRCIAWIEAAHLSKYLPGLYDDIPNKAFPGLRSSKKHSASYCRNPTPQTKDGPWCFIHYMEHGRTIHSWEYCDVCSKTKPVAEMQFGFMSNLEVVKTILYLSHDATSDYECQHLCSVLAHCSTSIFIRNGSKCHFGWRNVAKDMSDLSLKKIVGANMLYIFRKPCITKEQGQFSLIKQWCFVDDSCYFSDKIEYTAHEEGMDDKSCATHCLKSNACFQYLVVENFCYIYKQDVCSCSSDFEKTRLDVTVVSRCYEHAADETYFENDDVYNTFNAEDYHIHQKSALSWVPEDESADTANIEKEIERTERNKDMGNLEDEGISPAYLSEILKMLIVTWTSIFGTLTFYTCAAHIQYF